MKSLNSLMQDLNSQIKQAFSFKEESDQMYKRLDCWIEGQMTTFKGNNRYPKKYGEALRSFLFVMVEQYRNEKTIFCYEVDGKLYTTYNPNNKKKYSFKGETEIPNYRTVEGIEEKILHNGSNSNGFCYPCGKKFYFSKK